VIHALRLRSAIRLSEARGHNYADPSRIAADAEA
jgi:hypothetical protein